LRFKNEEGIGKHKCKGTKNDEGKNGTICNANNGISSHTDCRSTIDDNSTWDIAKGANEGGTTNGMSIGKTVEGVEIGS
jgi:hypothetical protein